MLCICAALEIMSSLVLYMIFESYNELAAVVNDSFTFFINLVSSPHEKKKKHLA